MVLHVAGGPPGIPVDVLDLFYEFAGGEGVEVVVARLPELVAGAFEEFGGFSFEDSEEGGQSADLRFAGQEMDVLGIRT